MNTPWGTSDSITRIKRGLSWVGTPSHGGFAVSDGYARKHLSPAALLRGERRGNYYFYEEDCAYAIVAWDLFGFLQNPILSCVEVPGLGEFTRATLLKSLSTWNADYLIECGTEPDAEGLAIFNAHKLRDRLQRDKSPDLVVSAVGDWHKDCPKTYVLVTCADDSRWFVKDAEYSTRQPIVTLLSTFTNPIPQGRNGEDTLRYKVHNGDKELRFPTVEAANTYCNEVIRTTGVVLAVEEVR